MKKMMTLMLAGCVTLLAVQSFAADPKKEFVGSDACKKCHAVEYKSWKETYHSKMVQTKKAGILKEAVEKWATDGTNDGPTTGNVSKTPFKLDDVQFVVGSRWKQRYLVKNDQTGGLQFLNKHLTP